MNWIGRLSALGCLALSVNTAVAQFSQPHCATPPLYLPPGCPTPVVPGTNPDGTPRTVPDPMAPAAQPSAAGDAFAQAPEGGTQPAASFNPAMFGDLLGVQGRRVIFIPRGVTPPPGSKIVDGNRIAVLAPVPNHAAFKVTEEESPRPTNRVYFNYNFYNDVTRLTPGVGASDLHRETLGFEKTLFGGDASFGLRLPFQQLVGDSQVQDYQVADMSLIFKYALVNDRCTGDVLSTGLVLTLPTGKAVEVAGESPLNATLFQPFVGYIVNFDDWFIQGFSSLSVPTDSRDVTLFFNSVSAGYWLYRSNESNATLRGIVPAVELHLNTPLNHRGLREADPISYPDSLNGTLGAHFLFSRATVGLALGTPLIGPRPYDVEVTANLSFQW